MNRAPQQHTDIPTGDWIDRLLPENLRPYARLMRLDRPIGTWLLLLPCWWAVALASDSLPDLWLMTLFAAGALIMRGAGCVVNDVYDRDFDKKVDRTQTRPLASGQLALWQALIFLAALLLLGFLVLLQFNMFTVWLGVASLALVFTYPLAKRITWWPQFVLGLAFNWGALMGWSAVRGSIEWPAMVLYVGGIFWTLGYDTIYAHQDKNDDILIGIKSLALRLGDSSKKWITVFFASAITLFLLSGAMAEQGAGYYILMIAAVSHATWQLSGWNTDDPANCLRRFRSNRDFGLIVLVAIIAGKFM